MKAESNSPQLLPYLVGMSIMLALCMYGAGGVVTAYLRAALICIGFVGFILFRRSARMNLAPRMSRLLRWAWLLLLLYAVIQSVPLPREIVSALSPHAARIQDAVSRISTEPYLFSISVLRSATIEHVARLVGYFMVFMIARELSWRADHDQWKAVVPLLLVASAEALLGVTQYALSGGTRPATGTYVNRNHFAGLLETTFPFAAVYCYTTLLQRNIAHCLLWCSLTALLGIGVLCSLSRMASVIVFGSCILIAVLLVRPRRIAIPAVIAATAIVFFIFVPTQLLRRFSDLASAGEWTDDLRVRFWSDTLKLIADYAATGTGLGTYAVVVPRYRTVELDQDVLFAHNDYLQVAAELGLMGLLPLVCLVACILYPIAKTIVRGTGEQFALSAACLTSVMAILVHSVADFNLYIPANAIVLSWIAGVAVMLPWTPGGGSDPPPHVVTPYATWMPPPWHARDEDVVRSDSSQWYITKRSKS